MHKKGNQPDVRIVRGHLVNGLHHHISSDKPLNQTVAKSEKFCFEGQCVEAKNLLRAYVGNLPNLLFKLGLQCQC